MFQTCKFFFSLAGWWGCWIVYFFLFLARRVYISDRHSIQNLFKYYLFYVFQACNFAYLFRLVVSIMMNLSESWIFFEWLFFSGSYHRTNNVTRCYLHPYFRPSWKNHIFFDTKYRKPGNWTWNNFFLEITKFLQAWYCISITILFGEWK